MAGHRAAILFNQNIVEQFCNALNEEEKKYEDLLRVVANVREEHQEQSEKQMLRHIEKLIRMIRRFSDVGMYYMKKILEENSILWNDLWKGGEELEKVRAKMEECEDGFIKRLIDICDFNAAYLNKRHYKTGVVKDAQLNKTGIEFILRLYYSRKIKSAQIRCKGDDGDDES